jgi:DNA-binding NarL/FixJ family response regulator
VASQVKKTRVVLADDHPVVRAGVGMIINGHQDLELAGQASSGLEALEIIRAIEPEIAIIDISLPQMNGIVLARRLSQEHPSVGVIVLTQHEERSYLNQALEAGARGYVLKRSTAECLIHAIRGVLVGGLYVDPAIAGQMFESAPRKVNRSASGALPMTQRESDVLRLVAIGLTTREIAERLDLGPKSVETYKSRATAKIGVKTRSDIVRYASAQGWLTDV